MRWLRYVTATAVVALGLALAPAAIAYGAGGGHGGGFGGGFGGHFGGHGFAGGMHMGDFGAPRITNGVREHGFGGLAGGSNFDRRLPVLGSPGLTTRVHGGHAPGRFHHDPPILDPDDSLFGYYPSYCSQYPDWYNPAAGCYYPWYG